MRAQGIIVKYTTNEVNSLQSVPWCKPTCQFIFCCLRLSPGFYYSPIVAWTRFWLGNSAWDFGFGFVASIWSSLSTEIRSTPPPPLGRELVGGFWNGNIYDETRLLWTERMDDLLSCNMWLYARVIFACTGIKWLQHSPGLIAQR